jgi:hypothetical protein
MLEGRDFVACEELCGRSNLENKNGLLRWRSQRREVVFGLFGLDGGAETRLCWIIASLALAKTTRLCLDCFAYARKDGVKKSDKDEERKT